MRKLKEMKETFNVNHADNTIELTKQFAKASGIYDSDAYKMLLKAKNAFPDYKVVVKATPKRKQTKDNFRGLTYDYMERYIKNQDEHEEILKAFHTLRNDNDELTERATYGEIKKWFLKTFPEVKEFQTKQKDIINNGTPKKKVENATPEIIPEATNTTAQPAVMH